MVVYFSHFLIHTHQNHTISFSPFTKGSPIRFLRSIPQLGSNLNQYKKAFVLSFTPATDMIILLSRKNIVIEMIEPLCKVRRLKSFLRKNQIIDRPEWIKGFSTFKAERKSKIHVKIHLLDIHSQPSSLYSIENVHPPQSKLSQLSKYSYALPLTSPRNPFNLSFAHFPLSHRL